MSDFSLLSCRAEVRDFLRSTERLIASAVMCGNTPLTPNEQEIVECYLAEVGKILIPVGKQKQPFLS